MLISSIARFKARLSFKWLNAPTAIMKFQNLKLNYRIPFLQLKLTLAIDVEEDSL